MLRIASLLRECWWGLSKHKKQQWVSLWKIVSAVTIRFKKLTTRSSQRHVIPNNKSQHSSSYLFHIKQWILKRFLKCLTTWCRILSAATLNYRFFFFKKYSKDEIKTFWRQIFNYHRLLIVGGCSCFNYYHDHCVLVSIFINRVNAINEH